MQIHELMPKVAAEIGAIGKDKRNEQGKYNFRGIDDIYNALSGPLAKHGVFMTSEVFDVQREERESRSGGTLCFTILKMRVIFWAPDGSSVSGVWGGEAFDSGDKSMSKAMSNALKYAAFQSFCIPVKIPDNDEQTHEVAPRGKAKDDIRKTAGQLFLDKVAAHIRDAKYAQLWGGKEKLFAWYNANHFPKYGPMEKLKENDDDLAMMALWGKVLEHEQDLADNGVPVTGVL